MSGNYGGDFNSGWAAARASQATTEMLQSRFPNGGAVPISAVANLVILCVILCGTAGAVYGVMGWIHDMPFFLHHPWIKNVVYWTVGLCTYSLLFVLREFIRALLTLAFLGLLVWMACSFIFAFF